MNMTKRFQTSTDGLGEQYANLVSTQNARQPGQFATLAADQVVIPKNHKEALSSEYPAE
eukprot:gene31402-6568_t